jgi:hypothetical protein
MRVGTKQKKIDINIPSLEDFIHHVYINVARKIYTNVYLFEIGITALKSQKNSRELEIIIKECILQTIRETIPVEELLKLYMNETVENAIEVHEKQEIISQEPVIEALSAGNISNPASAHANSIVSAKQLAEESETLSKIKAASGASGASGAYGVSGASGASGVSFNMDNNEVISVENISDEIRNDDDYGGDDDDEDDYDEDGEENVKLSIGDNVELSVDPFPNDNGDSDTDNDSNIDLNIEEIPIIDDY